MNKYQQSSFQAINNEFFTDIKQYFVRHLTKSNKFGRNTGGGYEQQF